MNEEIVVHTYDGILLSHKGNKVLMLAITQMNPKSKLSERGQTQLYIYIAYNSRKGKSLETENGWFQGLKGGKQGVTVHCLMGLGFSFLEMKMFWN